MVQNFSFFSVQAEITCLRQAEAVAAWQRATFTKLRAAYFELLRAHEAEVDARSVQAGIVVSGESPLENARRIRRSRASDRGTAHRVTFHGLRHGRTCCRRSTTGDGPRPSPAGGCIGAVPGAGV